MLKGFVYENKCLHYYHLIILIIINITVTIIIILKRNFAFFSAFTEQTASVSQFYSNLGHYYYFFNFLCVQGGVVKNTFSAWFWHYYA